MTDGLRILVVEELPGAAELIARRLTVGGLYCVPRQVSNEKDFRAALHSFVPQVILSERILKDFSGLTALGIARTELPEVPFIFFSSTPGEEHAVEALRRGAVDYVLKSNPGRLFPAVTGALRALHERAQRYSAEQLAREKDQHLHDQQHHAPDSGRCRRPGRRSRRCAPPARPRHRDHQD